MGIDDDNGGGVEAGTGSGWLDWGLGVSDWGLDSRIVAGEEGASAMATTHEV